MAYPFTQLGFLFLILTIFGYWWAYLRRPVRRIFRWSAFASIILWPLLYVVALTVMVGGKVLLLFCVSAVIGMFLEYSLGLIYDRLQGEKLWQYKKWSINGYTSWLCLPAWGIAGVIFWSLSKAIGL